MTRSTLVRRAASVTRRCGVLAALFAAAMLSGCGSTERRTVAVEIPVTSPRVALAVDNFRGSVEVRVDPRLNGVRVESGVEADGMLDEKAQAEIRAAVEVDAAHEEQHGQSVVRVVTRTRRPGATDHRVHLRITMPQCDGLDISNRGGLVMAVGTRGSARVVNREGPIEFRSNIPITDPMTLTTTDANIFCQLAPGSSAAFNLETLDGSAELQDRTTGVDKVYSTRTRYEARLNKGTNPIVARTNRGDVMFWVMDDPEATTRVSKDSLPNPLDFINLKGSQRYLRNLPEDHPEVQAGIDSDLPYSGP